MWLLLLTACSDGDTWLQGTWRLASWSAVGESPAFEVTVEDAGTVSFDGNGEWWESRMHWDAPELLDATTGSWVRTLTWAYWGGDGAEIRFGWTQDFSEPEVVVVQDRSADGWTGVSEGDHRGAGQAALSITYVFERSAE